MAGRPVRGYRQGSLDGLCGFYCIVNAVKAASQNSGRHHNTAAAAGWFRRQEAFALFQTLAKRLEHDRRLALSYGEGIEPPTLTRLLRQADRWLDRNLSYRLIARRAYIRPARPTRARMVAAIERHLSRPNTAAIVGLDGQLGHWTVATAASPQAFRLADSDGGYWLRKRPLRRNDRTGAHAGLIDPYTLFLIEVRLSEPSRTASVVTFAPAYWSSRR